MVSGHGEVSGRKIRETSIKVDSSFFASPQNQGSKSPSKTENTAIP